MKVKAIGLWAILLIATVVASSQQPSQPGPPRQPGPIGPRPAGQPPMPHQPGQPPMPHQAPTPDPIAQNLFPPELVMQHRHELGLSDEQRAAIKDEAIKASTRFNELQWQMQDEVETMANLLKGVTVDEQKVLAQLDKVLNVERDVKRTQLGLSIRIKNKLTAEQQEKLREFQRFPPPPR